MSGFSLPGYEGVPWIGNDPGMPGAATQATGPIVAPQGYDPMSSLRGIPGASPTTGAGVGLGWNIGTGQLAMSGLGALGNIWSAWQANDLAKQTFNFQKRMGERNLANSIASYNTQLEDRSRARAHTEGQTGDTQQAYVDRNRLR